MNSTTRPNIMLIMTDEQRFDSIGYVDPQVLTPNLDRLANDSIVFTSAYTTNPSCIPARAAIFTGLYPSRCDTPTYTTYLNDESVTFMSLLQKSGYYTSVVGKQHFAESKIYHGYNYEQIIDSHMPPQDFLNLDETALSQNSYFKYLIDSGFTKENQLTIKENRFQKRWIADEKYYIDSFVGDQGNSWLSNHAPSEKPWFFWLSFPGPHMPYDGIGLPDFQQYENAEISLPFSKEMDLALKPRLYRSRLESADGTLKKNLISEDEIRNTRKAYFANISLIDRKVGEIISTLKQNNMYDNTLIIFASDHGDYMGDFGLMGKGQYLAEVLMRVPFFIKPPISSFAGTVDNSFVSSVDIAATCLSAAKVLSLPRFTGQLFSVE